MKNSYFHLAWILLSPLMVLGQSSLASLSKSLSFAATFDQDIRANLAKGEEGLFMAASYEELESPIADQLPAHIVRKDGGKVGKALAFTAKEKPVIFYQALQNVRYSQEDWSGTISLWLSVDPEEDLAPGYTDPIQITDSGYDDAALWVDFSDKNPRDFRMGIFGDVAIWNPQKKKPNENPDFLNRLVKAEGKPFGNDHWTHIVMTFEHLNSQNGVARFYINGAFQGERSIVEPFTWDVSDAKIFLGLNYIGLMDEISIFDRVLQKSEIQKLYSLDGGITDLLDE